MAYRALDAAGGGCAGGQEEVPHHSDVQAFLWVPRCTPVALGWYDLGLGDPGHVDALKPQHPLTSRSRGPRDPEAAVEELQDVSGHFWPLVP